jgi:hypothetical protein
MLKSHSKIFQYRHNFSKLLDLKEFDKEKDAYQNHVVPLSAYDKLNEKAVLKNSYNFNKNIIPENSTDFNNKFIKNDKCFNFKSHSESANNMLLQKRVITNLSQKNGYFCNTNSKIFQTEKHKFKKENLTFSYDILKKNFMRVAEDKKYPRVFLPEPGFGLLENPFPFAIVSKKKKRKSIMK